MKNDDKSNKAQTNKKVISEIKTLKLGASSVETSDDKPIQESLEKPFEQAPHLAQRMVHPALLQGSKIMNLGGAAQRFGSENIVLSPKTLSRRSSLENTPTAPQAQSESQRPFSLAEAMRAARRLNMEQISQESVVESPSTLGGKETDLDTDITDMNITESDSQDDSDSVATRHNSIDDDSSASVPAVVDKLDDAKNIEIRRLSNTDEGNKVLEPSFHSPEKDTKKNPLQNILNIVSGMEVPDPPKSNEDDRETRFGPMSSGVAMIRPQLKGRKKGQYSTLSPMVMSQQSVPWMPGGQPHNISIPRGFRPTGPTQIVHGVNAPMQAVPSIVTSTQNQVMLAMPQPVQIMQPSNVTVSQTSQPVFQLVQTMNGTMLVQMPQPVNMENRNVFQVQQSTSANQASPSGSASSSNSSSPGSSSSSPPSGKKNMKRKFQTTLQAIQPNSVPIQQPLLLSPSGNVLQTIATPGTAVVTGNGQLISSAGQQPNIIGNGALPQNMIVNPPGQQMIVANGAMMTMPQGVMYQHLPDGTLVPVAQQVPMLAQGGQQLLAAPMQGQVLVNGSGQMIPTGSQQFIMTPQGLMQTVGPVPNVAINTHNIPKKKSKHGKKRHKQAKSSSSDTSMDTENNEGSNEGDADTSFEDPQPSTSKDFSSKASIQSNQVDSSGLNATPPYQKDGEYEQLRSVSDGDSSFHEMDTSIDTSRHSRMSGFSTPASNISLMEERISDCGSDLDHPIPSPKAVKLVSSSREKKKKKKKKKRSHESHSSGYRLGDIVWGPINGSPSWPGKIVSQDEDRTKVWVCWFATRQVTQIDVSKLKSLSEGLDDHHKERKNSRR